MRPEGFKDIHETQGPLRENCTHISIMLCALKAACYTEVGRGRQGVEMTTASLTGSALGWTSSRGGSQREVVIKLKDLW